MLKSPALVAVTFANDDRVADVDTFMKALGGSSYWKATTGEYGIGAATATPVHLTATAPASVDGSTIPGWLQSELDGTHPEWGTPDANTLYVLFYPQGTTLTVTGLTLCVDIGAYHDEAQLASGMSVPYAVIPRCASHDGLVGFDVSTVGASHEIIEAATDPLPGNSPAYRTFDARHELWNLFAGIELGDACAMFDGPSVYFKPADLGYMVQRTWSNAAIAHGDDPCTPSLPGEVYFNSVPVLSDSATVVSSSGVSLTNEAVQIAQGASKTIDIDLYSSAMTSGPWTVSAQDRSAMSGGPAELALSFDRTSGTNGDTLHLTITVLQADPMGAEGFVVTSQLGSQQTSWLGVVASQ